jgi:hypothetical protein
MSIWGPPGFEADPIGLWYLNLILLAAACCSLQIPNLAYVDLQNKLYIYIDILV